MSDKDLQQVTKSLSDIGQAPIRQNPPLLKPVSDPTFPKLTPKEEAFCPRNRRRVEQVRRLPKSLLTPESQDQNDSRESLTDHGEGKVRARIAELMTPVIAKAQMSRTEWLQIITKCCRFDLRQMFDTIGKPKKLTELDDNEAAAIEAFEISERSKVRMKRESSPPYKSRCPYKDTSSSSKSVEPPRFDLRFKNSNQVLTGSEDQQLEHADQSKSVLDTHNPATSRNHDLDEIE